MNDNLATLAPNRTRTRKKAATRTKSPERKARATVAAAFRKIGNGADRKTAYERTKAWYRSSGSAWANCLS